MSNVVLKVVKSSTKFQKSSAFKLRRVANLIRGKSVTVAVPILKALPHKGSKIILKVLMSGIANAEHNFNMNRNNLIISEILINEGPQTKRFQPRAKGRICQIIKRTAHVNISLNAGSAMNGGV